MPTKTENGVEYPKSAYLYTPDPESPSTWKLRYKNYIDGKLKLDPEQLGKAVAAFSPGGFRGQKVDLPEADRKAVLKKIRSLYINQLKVKEADMPETLRSTQQTDTSLEDIRESIDKVRDAIWEAVQNQFGQDAWLQEVFPDYCVYSLGDQDFKVSWSLTNGEVALGSDSVEVEDVWVEVQSQQAADEGMELLMRLGEAQNPEGTAWEVIICQPGHTLNGWFIPDEVLRDAAALFEKVDVNLYELPQGASHVPDPLFDLKSLLVKNKVGWIDNVKHAAGVGLKGVLHFLDSAKWLGKNLLSAMKDGVATYGLSYDCPVRAMKAVIDGKQVVKVVKFNRADSVDIVTRPAAGGKFNRAVASMPAQKREDIMDKKKIWDMIHATRPDLLKGKEFDKISDQEIEALARMAMEPEKKEPAPSNEVNLLRCEMLLDKTLGGITDMPDILKDNIRRSFMGKVFTKEDLDKAIADGKDLQAKLIPQPPADSVTASSVTGGLGTLERAQMAVDRMFGLTKDDMLKLAGERTLDNRPFFADMRSVQDYQDFDKVPVFHSLREMYAFFTGDPNVDGVFRKDKLPVDMRARADINSGTFTYVLGNTMARRLVSGYRAADFGESLLISVRKSVKDFRTQEAVLVGGFGDLPTVDPEAQDYPEAAAITDEESTYTVGQKGRILSITRKTIINDDISVVQRLINNQGLDARRTHAKYVWAFWKDNANCSDGTAWFTGGHGNLGATALSFAQALVAYIALAKMTEKDSAERIGLLAAPAKKLNFIYPPDLRATAYQIINQEVYYTSNDLTTATQNSLIGKLNGFENPLLTDTNDWGILLPPDVIDMVEMGYLNGRQEPELFVADMPQSEKVFMADKIRYKIRHEYGGAVIDFRSGWKAQVT